METHVLGSWKVGERLPGEDQLATKARNWRKMSVWQPKGEVRIQVDVWAGIQERQGGLGKN